MFDKNKYQREWREKNKNKSVEYYQKSKSRIKEYYKKPEVMERIRKYRRKYYKKNKLRLQQYENSTKRIVSKRNYRQRPYVIEREKLRNRRTNDILCFGGNREKVLERDKYACQICGMTHHDIRLDVHHIDGTGRKNKKHNNSMNNLVTLCISCHMRIHNKNIKKSNQYDKKWLKEHLPNILKKEYKE